MDAYRKDILCDYYGVGHLDVEFIFEKNYLEKIRMKSNVMSYDTYASCISHLKRWYGKPHFLYPDTEFNIFFVKLPENNVSFHIGRKTVTIAIEKSEEIQKRKREKFIVIIEYTYDS